MPNTQKWAGGGSRKNIQAWGVVGEKVFTMPFMWGGGGKSLEPYVLNFGVL